MPLTKAEREFLDAYVYEATHEPFGGPASRDLRQRGISYNDLNWLLTAYHRESCAEGISPFGRENPNPPPSPWADLQSVRCRSEAVGAEYEKANNGHPGGASLTATQSDQQGSESVTIP